MSSRSSTQAVSYAVMADYNNVETQQPSVSSAKMTKIFDIKCDVLELHLSDLTLLGVKLITSTFKFIKLHIRNIWSFSCGKVVQKLRIYLGFGFR